MEHQTINNSFLCRAFIFFFGPCFTHCGELTVTLKSFFFFLFLPIYFNWAKNIFVSESIFFDILDDFYICQLNDKEEKECNIIYNVMRHNQSTKKRRSKSYHRSWCQKSFCHSLLWYQKANVHDVVIDWQIYFINFLFCSFISQHSLCRHRWLYGNLINVLCSRLGQNIKWTLCTFRSIGGGEWMKNSTINEHEGKNRLSLWQQYIQMSFADAFLFHHWIFLFFWMRHQLQSSAFRWNYAL